jgi:DNA-binding CsgD family transcriptional regulator
MLRNTKVEGQPMRTANLEERRSFAEANEGDRSQTRVDYGFLHHALARWMEADSRARLLVDRDLRAWWVSPAADAVMGQIGSLLIRNGHVRTRENRFDRQLRELIEGAGDEIAIQCIHDPRTSEHVVLTAQRLSAPSDHLVGLTLQRACENFVFRLADLHEAFGFTRTEGRVAYHLMCGRTAEETANHLQVSLETVRTHIKRGYAKLGVSSREAFFHRLTPFVILLA